MAGAVVGALRVTLGIDTAAFEEGLGIAQKRLNAAGKKMQEVGESMASVGSNLSVAVTAPLLAAGAAAVQGAQAQAQAMAQVNAALESMGPVAGRTAEQLLAASDALEMNSLFDGDEILSKVTANLLTFGNVAGEQFDRAQQAAVDLSTRMKTDLQSSTILIGKALNDPIKGMTALGKAGIQFSEDQKAAIKAMVETGNIAGAQNIILGELGKQYNGAAKAAADTDPWRKAQVAIGQMGDAVGEMLLPVITQVAGILKTIASGFSQLSPVAQGFIVVAAGIAAAVGPVLVVLGTLVTSIGALIPVFAPLLAVITGAFGAGGVFAGAFGSLSAFSSMLSLLAGAFAPVVAAITPFLIPIAAVAAVGALIYANWDKIAPVLQTIGGIFQAQVMPKVTQAAARIGDALSELWEGPFGQALRDAGTAIGKLGGIIGEFAQGAGEVFGPILARIFDAFIIHLTSIFSQVGLFIEGVSKLVTLDFAGAWETAKELVATAVNGWIDVLRTLFPETAKVIGELIDGFSTWFGGLATRMVTFGGNIIDGLVKGIKAAPEAVWRALKDVVLRGVENVREMLGIASPSKLFMEMGGFVSEGMALGITGGLPQVESAMDKLGSTVADRLGAMTPGQGLTIDAAFDGEAVGQAGAEAGSQLRDTFRQTFADGIKAALDGDLGGFLEQTFNSIFDNVTRNLADALANALGGLFGGAGGGGGLGDVLGGIIGGIFGGSPGFALGGSFTVGGRPGRDANLVAFRATRGEHVAISRSEAEAGGPGGAGFAIGAAPVVNITNHIDASGADPAAIARLNTKLDQMNAELPSTIVRTVQDASNRRVINVGGRG